MPWKVFLLTLEESFEPSWKGNSDVLVFIK